MNWEWLVDLLFSDHSVPTIGSKWKLYDNGNPFEDTPPATVMATKDGWVQYSYYPGATSSSLRIREFRSMFREIK